MATCMILNRGDPLPDADPDDPPPLVQCTNEGTHEMTVYVAAGRSLLASICDEHFTAMYPRPEVETDPRITHAQ